jgi:1-acyl-sn-glycerol-3-phosphate acyltransferase
MLFYIGRSLFRLMFCLLGRWTVEGRENVPAEGGVILAPNHISYLDPPLAGAAVKRPVYFMAKRELFEIPIFGRIIRCTHAFPVSRGTADRRALRQAQELLQRGEIVVVFPEGTRSPDGRLQEPELGIALIAARAKVPVVPMAFIGSDRMLPRGSSIIRPARLHVRIGPPLRFPEVYDRPADREALTAVAHQITEAIRDLLPTEMR